MNIDKVQDNGYSMLVTKADEKENISNISELSEIEKMENKKFTLTVMLQNEKF